MGSSINIFQRLRDLVPLPTVLVGTVIAHNDDDTSSVQLPGPLTTVVASEVVAGAVIRARGTTVEVGKRAFVRAGVIETEAPDGDIIDVEVGQVVVSAPSAGEGIYDDFSGPASDGPRVPPVTVEGVRWTQDSGLGIVVGDGYLRPPSGETHVSGYLSNAAETNFFPPGNVKAEVVFRTPPSYDFDAVYPASYRLADFEIRSGPGEGSENESIAVRLAYRQEIHEGDDPSQRPWDLPWPDPGTGPGWYLAIDHRVYDAAGAPVVTTLDSVLLAGLSADASHTVVVENRRGVSQTWSLDGATVATTLSTGAAGLHTGTALFLATAEHGTLIDSIHLTTPA